MNARYKPLAAPRHNRAVAQFTGAELTYLLVEQRLGRLAAGDSTAAPHVAPGGRSYSPDLSTIDISGHNFAANPKFRNIQTNPQAAFVVDDAGLIVR